MSMGLHSAREELGLPNVAASGGHALFTHTLNGSTSSGFLSGDVGQQLGGLPKPISLSPRTFGMEDLRDFAGPVNTFKTGLTPRVFSTGLTPRSGFTPRFTTGFTPRVNVGTLGQPDSSAYLARGSSMDTNTTQKISPSGFTPKDVGGVKVPMRFPGAFSSGSPPKMEQYKQEQPTMQQLHQQQMHPTQLSAQQHAEMQASMGMPMYDYMNRPVLQTQHAGASDPRSSVTPNSDRVSDQEDLDERRRMKNRERVRKCRKRKQDRLNFLEDRTAELEKENDALKAKVARTSASSPQDEALSEAQLNERRKQQNTTLAAYMRAYNDADGANFEANASAIFADGAEIVDGSGEHVSGLKAIVANKKAAADVFARYELSQQAVQWKANASDKCVVSWDVTATVKPDAKRDVVLTKPLAALGPHFGAAAEPLSFRMTSHVTFQDGKVLEEIRHLQLAKVGEKALERYAADPKKAAEVLRCLMQAA